MDMNDGMMEISSSRFHSTGKCRASYPVGMKIPGENQLDSNLISSCFKM